jgi:hypothetical protein
MRIFTAFFHPAVQFAAVGSAEKRLIQVLKVWDAEEIRQCAKSVRFLGNSYLTGEVIRNEMVDKGCYLEAELIYAISRRKCNRTISYFL